MTTREEYMTPVAERLLEQERELNDWKVKALLRGRLIAELEARVKELEDGRAAFTRGYAVCLANACRTESWQPRDIDGGMTVEMFEDAGCEKYDIDAIRKYWDEMK